MKRKRKSGRCIQLFLILFILLFPLSGCNIFIGTIDSLKDEPTPEPPPESSPEPSQEPTPTPEPTPRMIITGLSEAGTIEIEAGPIVVNGSYLYAAGSTGSTDNFRVIDFSEPSSPGIMGKLSIGSAGGITTQGQFAYVQTNGGGASSYPGCVMAIDCSNPSAPFVYNYVHDGYNDAYQIYYHNEYLYSCSGSKVSVYEVLTTGEVSYNTYISCTNGEWAAPWGNRLFFTELYNPGALQIYDISDPPLPDFKNELSFSFSWSSSIAVKEGYVFVLFNDGFNVIIALDISNPDQPQEISSMTIASGSSSTFFDAKIVDDYLFVCGIHDFYVIDVYDPYNMSETGFISLSNAGYSCAITGDYAIVSDAGYYKIIYLQKEPEPTPGP